MASLERLLLRRFIDLFEEKSSQGLGPGDATDSGASDPTEKALAILLALEGDVVSLGSAVYRREGLSVVVYRDVPRLDPEATLTVPAAAREPRRLP